MSKSVASERKKNSLSLSSSPLFLPSIIPHMNPLCGRSTVCKSAASNEKLASGAWATIEATASAGEEEESIVR